MLSDFDRQIETIQAVQTWPIPKGCDVGLIIHFSAEGNSINLLMSICCQEFDARIPIGLSQENTHVALRIIHQFLVKKSEEAHKRQEGVESAIQSHSIDTHGFNDVFLKRNPFREGISGVN